MKCPGNAVMSGRSLNRVATDPSVDESPVLQEGKDSQRPDDCLLQGRVGALRVVAAQLGAVRDPTSSLFVNAFSLPPARVLAGLVSDLRAELR
jgi:hypothetical protein